MKTKTEHTPTPSCLGKNCRDCWPKVEWVEEDQILIVNDKTYSKHEVVRAVNSHEALLEAAKLGLASIESEAGNMPSELAEIEFIKKTIAQAEALS